MKPFIYDPLHTNPQDVARRDYLEHFVEAVLDHRGNPALEITIREHGMRAERERK